MIDENIVDLVAYAYRTGLIEKEDITYSLNTILMQLGLTELEGSEEDVIKKSESIDQKKIDDGTYLEGTMKDLCKYAADNKI
ncbi:MAG: galactose-1-phosphate uridylyltransferase, partial [Butyrivibrio sp.]|nr:galactose-1-phosphate uridylyltransferase [Butyrivibrio sp.]